MYYVEQQYNVHSGDYLGLKSTFKMWRQLFQCHQLNSYKEEKLISINLDNQNIIHFLFIFISNNHFLSLLKPRSLVWARWATRDTPGLSSRESRTTSSAWGPTRTPCWRAAPPSAGRTGASVTAGPSARATMLTAAGRSPGALCPGRDRHRREAWRWRPTTSRLTSTRSASGPRGCQAVATGRRPSRSTAAQTGPPRPTRPSSPAPGTAAWRAVSSSQTSSAGPLCMIPPPTGAACSGESLQLSLWSPSTTDWFLGRPLKLLWPETETLIIWRITVFTVRGIFRNIQIQTFPSPAGQQTCCHSNITS